VQVQRVLVDLVLTVLPKLAGGGLMLLLGLVLIGSLPAAEYGRYALAVTVILLADAVVGTPFDLAVLRLAQPLAGTDDAAALAVERQALWLKLGLAGVLGLAAAGVLAALGGPAAEALLVAAAGVALLLLRSMLLHLQMRQRFRAYGAVEIAHAMLKFGPAFVLVALGAAAVGPVLACLAVGPLLAACVALRFVPAGLLRPPRPVRLAPLGGLVAWYAPTLALGAVLAQIDILLLGVLAPPDAVGHFGAAATVASVPSLIGLYLGVVLTPLALRHAAAGTLRPVFVRVQAALAAAALLFLAVVVALLLSPLPERLPPGYAGSVPVFAVLLPGTLVAMMTAALSLPLVLVGRKDWLLRLDLRVAPVALLAYLLAIPAAGALGAAVVTLAVMLLRSAAVLRAAWRITAAPITLGDG
jgi:O-antigen/teichoic acid export membrane protein